MKFLAFLSLLFSCFSFSQTSEVRTIDVNGLSRTYRLYVPAIYTAGDAVPLVFNFHGYTSNASEQEFYGDFTEIADTANFILVHPQGTDPGTGAYWNSAAGTGSSNFDYQFVEAMVAELQADFSIDATRIYSTGMSNGGFMSYDMACFMQTKFAAIASVTGSMVLTHTAACNPGRKVPVMQIHGTTDPTVNYSGSTGVMGIEDLVAYWVQKNACNLTPVETNVPNIVTADNCTAIHYVYSGNEVNSAVEFYKVVGGGHTWPGAIFPILGQNTNQDFSASKEIWRFFSKYALEPGVLSVENITEEKVSAFPNPANNEITVKFTKNSGEPIYVYDFSGKLIRVLTTKKSNEKYVLDTKQFEPGVYYFKIENERIKVLITY